MDEFEIYKDMAVAGFFGLIGGFTKMAVKVRNGERFTVLIFFCNCFIAFVAGGLIGLGLHGSPRIAAMYGCAFVAGYVGGRFLDALEERFMAQVSNGRPK